MLLSPPPVDGPPHVMVERAEYSLGAIRVAVKLAPSSEEAIEYPQTRCKIGQRGSAAKETFDPLA